MATMHLYADDSPAERARKLKVVTDSAKSPEQVQAYTTELMSAYARMDSRRYDPYPAARGFGVSGPYDWS